MSKRTLLPLGQTADRVVILADLDLLRSGRVLIQASSGAGKSETIKKLATLTINTIPNVIVDPEGEYAALRSQLPFLLIGPGGEAPAALETVEEVIRLILKTGVSAVLDLSELSPKAKLEYARRFFETLHQAKDLWPRNQTWGGMVVTVDEAHVFAPKDKDRSTEALEAFSLLASAGRKRGYTIVVATQRLSLLHNDVAALCENYLFGRTGLIDQARTTSMLGYAGREAKDFARTIGNVSDGDFFAYGRAFGVLEPTLFHVDRVPGPTLAKASSARKRVAPPTPESLRKLLPQFEALPQEVEQKKVTEKTLRDDLAVARKRIGELERAAVKSVEPRKGAGTARVAVPTVDKEKLRMLGKKLEQLSVGLNEAVTLQATEEANKAKLAELVSAFEKDFGTRIADLRKLVTTSSILGKVLKRATEARDGANEILPQLTSTEAAPKTSREVSAAAPVQAVDRSTPDTASDRGLDGPSAKVLDNIAWMENSGFADPAVEFVAHLSGYGSASSSSFKNPRSRLKEKGLVTYPDAGRVRLTKDGRALSQPRETPASVADLHEAVITTLPGPEAKMLRLLIDLYPEQIAAADLATQCGYGSPSSSSFKNPRSRLKALGFAGYPTAGSVRATELLFPERV